jgi:hypothetical protein
VESDRLSLPHVDVDYTAPAPVDLQVDRVPASREGQVWLFPAFDLGDHVLVDHDLISAQPVFPFATVPYQGEHPGSRRGRGRRRALGHHIIRRGLRLDYLVHGRDEARYLRPEVSGIELKRLAPGKGPQARWQIVNSRQRGPVDQDRHRPDIPL